MVGEVRGGIVEVGVREKEGVKEWDLVLGMEGGGIVGGEGERDEGGFDVC